MPREQQTRIAPRVQPRVSKATERLQVVAQPRNTTVHPGETTFNQFADALAQVNPQIQQILGREAEEQSKEAYARGQQHATTLSIDDTAKGMREGSILPEESPWFRKGFSAQAGMRLGFERTRKLEEAYKNGGFDKQNGNLDDFILGQSKEDQPLLNDKYAMQGYTDVMAKTLQNLRNSHATDKAAEQRAAFTSDLTERMKEVVKDFDRHRDAQTLRDELESIRADGRRLAGMTNTELDDVELRTIHGHVIENKTDSKVFGVFDLPHADGQRGMSSRSERVEGLAKAKTQADAAYRAEKARTGGMRELEIREDLRKRADRGDIITMETLRPYVEDNTFSAVQAEAILVDAEKQRQGVVQQHNLTVALTADDLESSNQIATMLETSNGKKAVQAAYDDFTNKTLAHFAGPAAQQSSRIPGIYSEEFGKVQINSQTSERAAAAAQQAALGAAQDRVGNASTADATITSMGVRAVLKVGEKYGLLPTAWSGQLNNSDPTNPKQWAAAANLYSMIDSANPTYLVRNMPEDQRAKFHTYDVMIKSGASEDEAREAARRIGPRDMKRATAKGDPQRTRPRWCVQRRTDRAAGNGTCHDPHGPRGRIVGRGRQVRDAAGSRLSRPHRRLVRLERRTPAVKAWCRAAHRVPQGRSRRSEACW